MRHVLQNPECFLLIGCLIESIWPRKKQIKYIDTKNQLEKHTDQGKFSHVMNEIIICVCLTLAISVPSIVLERCRKEHKKMQVKKELQQNQSLWWIWSHDTAVRDPNVLASTASDSPVCTKSESQNVPLRSLNVEQTRTGRPVMGASSNYSEWNIDDKWSSQEWKSGEMLRARKGETRRWQVCHRWWNELWHRHRIEPFSEITIIIEQGWMIDCERNWTVLQKMQCKTSTNVLCFGECLCLRHWKHLYSWERTTQKICIPSKYRDNLILKHMFDISAKLIVEQSDEIFWSVLNTAGKTLHGNNYLCGNDEEVISLSHAKVYVFSDFMVMSWKGESNIKYCLRRTVELVQRFTTIQNFGHKWRRTDGIRVEYFPRIRHIAALQQSPKIHEQNGRTRTIPRTNYLHVDVQWQSYGDLKTMNRNPMLMPHLCLYLQKDSQQDDGHPSDLENKQSGILLSMKDQEENGIESLNWWWSKSPKAGHPVFRATNSLSQRSAQRQMRWKIISTLQCRWGNDWKLFRTESWKHRVLHNTCTKDGRNIKIRCIGLTSNLLKRKDWSSINHDQTLSFFMKHSQLIVSQKLWGWNLEKSYRRRYMRHLGLLQRFLRVHLSYSMFNQFTLHHKVRIDSREDKH